NCLALSTRGDCSMKLHLALILSSLSLVSSLSLAQDAKPASPPPQAPPPALITPEVHSDNSVTFRFRAPNAQEVKVTREGSPGPSDDREFYVYTPPGYDPAVKKTYPVLYLLHGYSDDASGWTAVGRANIILDNLIAQGKTKPMIVVMPLGYGTMEVIRAGWGSWGNTQLRDRNFTKFREAMLTEVMPRVE